MLRTTQKSYSAAFDTAMAELEQISNEFAQVRLRKEHVESVLQALTPLIGPTGHIAPRDFQRTTVSLQSGSAIVAPEPTPTLNQAPTQTARQKIHPANVAADPIQRRIDSVLGLATA